MKPTIKETNSKNFPFFLLAAALVLASGGQGALFEKTAPWTPAKTFYYCS
jgi:aspartate oxidase